MREATIEMTDGFLVHAIVLRNLKARRSDISIYFMACPNILVDMKNLQLS